MSVEILAYGSRFCQYYVDCVCKQFQTFGCICKLMNLLDYLLYPKRKLYLFLNNFWKKNRTSRHEFVSLEGTLVKVVFMWFLYWCLEKL